MTQQPFPQPTPGTAPMPPGSADWSPEMQAAWAQMISGGGQAAPGVSVIPGVGATKAEGSFYNVFFGTSAAPGARAGREDGEGGRIVRKPSRGSDVVKTYDEALALIYNADTQKRFIKLLIREGVVEEGDFGWDDVKAWWDKAVDDAAKSWKHGDRKITPYDAIEIYAGVNGVAGRRSQDGPRTTTSTDLAYQEVDDLDARALADDAYQQALGQAADATQAAALKAALDAYAREHPQVTTRTITRDAEGNESSTSSQSGGMTGATAQQIAEDQAEAAPTFAEFQSAAFFFPLLQQALGATADVDAPR